MKQLVSHVHAWDRLILLENHDVPLRTYEELQHILGLFGETNIQNGEHNSPNGLKGDYNRESLGTLLSAPLPNAPATFNLSVTHGFPQGSLTRAFVVRVMELHEQGVFNGFIADLAKERECSNDRFFPTLIYTNELQLPGHFYRLCSEESPIPAIVRGGCEIHMLIFFTGTFRSRDCCLSGTYRHGLCLQGLQDLGLIPWLPYLFINKLSPSFNYPAYNCLMEALEHKNQFPNSPFNVFAHISDAIYEDSPQTQRNKEAREPLVRRLNEKAQAAGRTKHGRSDSDEEVVNQVCGHPLFTEYIESLNVTLGLDGYLA